MERAFLLRDPSQGISGGYETITTVILARWGKEKSRLYTYCCPHQTCLIQVTTAFPDLEKTNQSKKSRLSLPYFRAIHGLKHLSGCPYNRSSEGTRGTGISTNGGVRTAATVAKAPSVFVEDQSNPGKARTHHDGKSSIDDSLRPKSGNPNSFGTRESISSASQLSTFSGFWHENRTRFSRHPLAVKECSGKTYDTVFKELNKDVAKNYSLSRRHIYWAFNPSVKPYGKSFSIRFGLATLDKLSLSFWLTETINGLPLPQDLIERLQKASRQPITIYALGRFKINAKKRKLEFTPDSIHHIWAELGEPKA